jgi:tripartite ATP-independent transporter DctP family solute receptor
MNIKIRFFFGLLGLLVSVEIAHAQSTLRLWNIHAEGYPVTVALNSFAQEVQKNTNGRVKVEVFSNGVLGDQPKAVQMVKSGELDMAEFGLGPLSEAAPSLKSVTLPFLFSDSTQMFRLLDGALGDRFKERLESAGFVVLGWYDGGARSFYCVKKKIRGPRDFAGLRIRVQATEVFQQLVQLLGAVPVPLPFKDVTAAFESGKIDCAENNMPSFISTGHYKLAKNVFLTEHVVSPEALVIGAYAWKKISPADQQILREAGKQSALYMRELWKKRVSESVEIATKAGVTFERPAEFGAYISRMKPLHQKYWVDPATRNELITILAAGSER